MALTASKQAGCALAALLASDRTLSEARPALEPTVAAAVAALLVPDAASRSQQIASLLARVRPQLRVLPTTLPVRMAALLAPRLARAVAEPVLARAPAPRANFGLSETLLPRLLRIARSESAGSAT